MQGFAFSIGVVIATLMTFCALLGMYLPGDVQITRAIQSVQAPGMSLLSDAIYWSGKTPYLQLIGLSVAGALVLFRHPLLAAFVAVALFAHSFAFLIKVLVERPRPDPLLVDVAHHSGGFSFPSGHVLSAVLLWGFIFYASQVIGPRSLRLGAQCFSAAMIVLMGFQRVYAGAHWPTDVIAAYLWGAILLFGIIKLFEYLRDGGLAAEQRAAAPAVNLVHWDRPAPSPRSGLQSGLSGRWEPD
jgi:membrane-associated phospholipid phosphatase